MWIDVLSSVICTVGVQVNTNTCGLFLALLATSFPLSLNAYQIDLMGTGSVGVQKIIITLDLEMKC